MQQQLYIVDTNLQPKSIQTNTRKHDAENLQGNMLFLYKNTVYKNIKAQNRLKLRIMQRSSIIKTWNFCAFELQYNSYYLLCSFELLHILL